jgi:PEP-CTERM motif
MLAGAIVAGGASAATLTPLHTASEPANDPVSWVPFPTAGDAYCSATDGCGTIPTGGQTASQWTTGDYVLSSVFTLPTTSVTDLTANWSFDNKLVNGSRETWFVYVNGIAVAQSEPSDCGSCGVQTVTGTVNFADIAPVAGGYQVELLLQNTLAAGDGSVAWLDGGMTGLSYSAVPEPSTWAMMGLGFAGIGFAGYRARRPAVAVA